jgi:hypothetical protein
MVLARHTRPRAGEFVFPNGAQAQHFTMLAGSSFFEMVLKHNSRPTSTEARFAK